MYRVGMYGGKFLPLHRGHVECILKAYTCCEELYIILSYNEEREKLLFKESKMKPISYKERYKWLYQLTKDLEHVHVLAVEDEALDEESYDWEKGAKDIKEAINKPIDVVFHSDLERKELFQKLYPTSQIVTFSRSHFPISATQLRKGNNIYKYWEYVPEVVRPYFIKKVCIIGTESSGKSTAVRNLAKYFNTAYVEEYGRNVCEEVGGAFNMQEKDFSTIAYGHKVLENEKLKQANKVLFVDTDSLVTKYYLNLYVAPDNTNPLFEAIHVNNDYDLYFFLEADVKWVQDGTRYHGEEEVRQNNVKKLKVLFDHYGVKYQCISGDYSERMQKMIEGVEKIL